MGKYTIVFGKRVRRFDFDKLTDRERFLLYCFPADVMAAYLFTTVSTIRDWTARGLPFVEIRGIKFYPWLTCRKWLYSPIEPGSKLSNFEQLYLTTYGHFPKYIVIPAKGEFKARAFWQVPVDVKCWPTKKQLKMKVVDLAKGPI